METKQQFFALYCGQEALCDVFGLDVKQRLIVDDNLLPTLGQKRFTNQSLLLKKLEDMSPQDAVELYNLKQGILSYQDRTYLKAFTYRNGVFQIEVENPSYNAYLIQDVVFHISDLSYKYIDLLRSKGYCLPYLNLSIEDLVERKWVTFLK